MVTPQLKAHFESLGVPLIALDAGARWLVDELASGSGSDVELVLGGEPKPLNEGAGEPISGPKTEQRFATHIDRSTHPFIASHVVKGGAVLPAVSALELCARVAAAVQPGTVSRVRGLVVLKGIVLGGYEGSGDRFFVTAKKSHPGTVEVLLSGAPAKGKPGTPHYRATVELDATPSGVRPVPELGALTTQDDVVYDGYVLFHGPMLHAIEAVKGESTQGIEGTLASARSLGWSDPAAITDTALLDGALQLAVLWTKHAVGGASLPTAIGETTLHGSLPAAAHVRCVVVAKGHTESRASFDAYLVDPGGVLLATMTGVDVHVLPGSREEVAARRATARA